MPFRVPHANIGKPQCHGENRVGAGEKGHDAGSREMGAAWSFLYLQSLKEVAEGSGTGVSRRGSPSARLQRRERDFLSRAAGWAARVGNEMGKWC